MGTKIVKCRLCQSNKLRYALKMTGHTYLICQVCTLLQREQDIKYDLTFDFSTGLISFDYYPYFLNKKEMPVSENSCMFFSLKAIELLLQKGGHKVINAKLNEGKLEVRFEKLNSLERLRLFEKVKKLSSQFTYFLASVKMK